MNNKHSRQLPLWTQHLTSVALLGASLFGLTACDTFADRVNAHADLVDDAEVATCTCDYDYDYDDCIRPQLGEFNRECMVDAFQGHRDQGNDYLDCADPVRLRYLECIETSSCLLKDPDDYSAYSPCHEELWTGLNECDQHLDVDVAGEWYGCVNPIVYW